MQRYDQNGDGVLQREEWEKMPGTPQAIDLDGDGQITKDELIWYLTHYGKTRTIHRTIFVDLSEPYKFDPANLQFFKPVVPKTIAPPVVDSETQESAAEGVEAVMKANEQLIDDDLYQKMLEERKVPSARPYYVLPESLRGVPAWFIVLDKNGDGQISLAEFAPTLDPRAIMRFKQLDKNNNGFIEPDEARTP
jgi:Ca2+-binding EF-hand superfamily protein